MSQFTQGPTAAFRDFVAANGVREFHWEDFSNVRFLCSGSYGTCYEATMNNGTKVALKFFGYTVGDPMAKLREIEKEVELDWAFNDLGCTAKCHGYMIDSREGYVSHIPRIVGAKPQLPSDPHRRYLEDQSNGRDAGYDKLRFPYHTGKRYKCSVICKVSECLRFELLDYVFYQIDKKEKVTEGELSLIFKSLIEALKKIHDANYIHRDIKAQNIMFNDLGEIRIIDLGYTIQLNSGAKESRSTSYFGSARYESPENRRRPWVTTYSYTQSNDIFAAGVILYVMLFHEYPYDSEFHQFKIPSNLSSAAASDLVCKLLDINPENRPTCKEILEHPWITRNGDFEYLIHKVRLDYGESFINLFKSINYRRQLNDKLGQQYKETRQRHVILRSILHPDPKMAGNMSKEKLFALRDAFIEINVVKSQGALSQLNTDEDGDALFTQFNYFIANSFIGSMFPNLFHSPDANERRVSVSVHGWSSALDYDSFMEIMTRNGLDIFAKKEVFEIFDVNSNGKIDYYEFMLNLATLTVSSKRRDMEISGRTQIEDDLKEEATLFFDMFDINGDNMIQKDEFRVVVCHLFGILDSDVILQGDLDRIYLMLDENAGLSRDKFEKFYRTLVSRTLSDNAAAEDVTREGSSNTERSEVCVCEQLS